VTVRDSAGVQIVENTAPEWADSAGWHLSPEPLMTIGSVQSAPEYELSGVSGALRLTDGRIEIANNGTHELRYYDVSGKYLSASGRKGKGPGEFEWLAWIARMPGDSVLAFDRSSQRMSVFDDSGHFVRMSHPTGVSGMAAFFSEPVGRFTDGSVVVAARRPPMPGADETGVVRAPTTLLRYAESGSLVDTLGQFPGEERYVQPRAMSGLLFGRDTKFTVHGNDLYAGSTDRYEIGVYTADGTLRRSIRRVFENLPVTSADIETVKQEQLDRMRRSNGPLNPAEFERMYAEMPIPKTMPAYAGLRVDAEGNLWVADYLRPSDHQSRFMVFDSTGRMLGSVVMPERFEPLDIGADYVLGRWRDELDVQYVRLYGLEKGRSTAIAGAQGEAQ
jgi:hypothetical protein